MAVVNNEEEKKDLTDYSYIQGGNKNVDNGYTPRIPDNGQFYCDAMNDSNINMVLNNVKPELIVLMGFSDYGKSTFVGSVYYYLLKKGEVEGYKMYDSDTFSGFERRFYLRNVKNDEELKSKTLRTEEDDEYLLTLNLYNPALREKKQIIISDRAGETYGRYVDIKERIKKDESMPRAQRVLIFLDTTKLRDDWDEEEGKFRQLLGGLKECGKMPKDATYTLLFNKIDLVEKDVRIMEDYMAHKQMIVDFFCSQLELTLDDLDSREIDSKHVHNNERFENLLKDLVKKDDASKNEEQRLKKALDWVGEKLK